MADAWDGTYGGLGARRWVRIARWSGGMKALSEVERSVSSGSSGHLSGDRVALALDFQAPFLLCLAHVHGLQVGMREYESGGAAWRAPT